MTSLVDKIRAALGRHASRPRETSETYGAPRAEEVAPLSGEPTLGSALGGYVEGMSDGGMTGPEPDTRPVDDEDSR